MLIAVIPAKNISEIKRQLQLASDQNVEGVEFRFDYWEDASLIHTKNLNALRELCQAFKPLKKIFTLRKKSQGGYYQNSEHERFVAIEALCQCEPDYFDLEFDTSRVFIEKIKTTHSKVNLIASYHNFSETPHDLKSILESMQNKNFSAYKIATLAQSSLDALRMMAFVKERHQTIKVTGICMGQLGQSTRILSPLFGNYFHYVVLTPEHQTAAGQLTLSELNNIYQFKNLNTSTKIYGLLGNPTAGSVGHILHNQAIRFLKQNAVYVKLDIASSQLAQAFDYFYQLPFWGFSITMPLKEEANCLLEKMQAKQARDIKKIKAINTISFSQTSKTKEAFGFNTDGFGAIHALEKTIDVSNKKIIILGAGGAARAIAYAAKQSGANVRVLNRTYARVQQLAKDIGCEAATLNILKNLKAEPYDVLINTLPGHAVLEQSELICSENFRPHTIAMDIIYQPIETSFLKLAKAAGCKIVFGYEMYIQQAILQIEKWFEPNSEEKEKLENLMRNYFETESH